MGKNIYQTYTENVEKHKEAGAYEPELYNLGELSLSADAEINDSNYNNEKKECDEIKVNGIEELKIKGMSDEEYNIYKFGKSLKNYEIYETDKNYKVSSWYNRIGLGADSKIYSKNIANKLQTYVNRLYSENNLLYDGSSGVTVSDWWARGLTNAVNKFTTGENGMSLSTQGKTITVMKDNVPLFSFNALGEGEHSVNDDNEIIFYPNNKVSAFLCFSDIYNTIATEYPWQKLWRDGADRAFYHAGDDFEEAGDLMMNVDSYIHEYLPYYNNDKSDIPISGEQYYYRRNDGSLVSGLGYVGQADIALKVMDGIYAVTKTNSSIATQSKAVQDKYLNDWNTHTSNTANLYIETPGGNDFNPKDDINPTLQVLTDDKKRRDIVQEISSNFNNCTFVLARHGLHWGYEITVPRIEKNTIWESNDKEASNQYTVFVEGALDLDRIAEIASRPENMAHSAVINGMLANSQYAYTYVSIPSNITHDFKNSEYTEKTDGNYSGAFNVYYNQGSKTTEFNWHKNGHYYNLNTMFGGDKQANVALEEYLTICQVINNLAYSLGTSTKNIKNHILYNKNFDDKYFDNFLNSHNSTGMTNAQILAIFAYPNSAEYIMHPDIFTQGPDLIGRVSTFVKESFNKYRANYNIEDYEEWNKKHNK